MKRLLLLGGGHSHVEVLRQFGARPLAGVEIALASPARYSAYSGMLPGLVAGHYDFRQCHIDLERLARFAGARFLRSGSRAIDTNRRQVVLGDESVAGYDILSIDVGSMPATDNIPGAARNAIALRPVETFLQAWDALIERARAGGLRRLAVIGGGAAGTEILLALQFRLAQLPGPDAVRFALITDAGQLLPDHNRRARAVFQRMLTQRRIDMHFDSRIARMEPGTAITTNGERISADAFIWATGAAAPQQLRNTGLMLDAAGFIAINERLQSTSNPEVFATGDCATIQGHVYPKSGVYAVRQGPPLAENLRRALTGKPLVTYRPLRRALALISTGNKYAVASYGLLALEGAWLWRWKDTIDRKFVTQYNVADQDAGVAGVN